MNKNKEWTQEELQQVQKITAERILQISKNMQKETHKEQNKEEIDKEQMEQRNGNWVLKGYIGINKPVYWVFNLPYMETLFKFTDFKKAKEYFKHKSEE